MNLRPPPNEGFDTPSTSEQVRRFGPPAIIGLAALLFVFQNADSVKFEFLWFDFSAPMFVMLLIFAGVGAIVFYGIQRRRRHAHAKAD